MAPQRPQPHGFAVLAAAILCGCAGSPTVRIPDADSTRPISALNVVEPSGKRIVLFPGDQPAELELAPGDSLVLIALGEDRDGGVKDLTLSGKAVAVCADSLGRGEFRKTGAFVRRHVLPARPGEVAPASRSARYVLRAADFQKLCGNQRLVGVTGAAGTRTVNYHGQSAESPTFEFRVAAGALARAPKTASTGDPASPKPQSTQYTAPVYGPIPPWEFPDIPLI